MVKPKLPNEICDYTHHKIVFWKKPKTILPEYNCNQDLFFDKTKNQIGFSIIAPGSLESPSNYIRKYLTSNNKSGILEEVKSA